MAGFVLGGLALDVNGPPQLVADVAGGLRPRAAVCLQPDGTYALTSSGTDQSELWSGQRLVASGTASALRHALFEDLQTRLLEEAHEVAMVHAGVVAVSEALVVLPGSSHAGKTTLVAAMLALGASYYSDEYAIVARDGSVEGFPRPLALRDPSCVPAPLDEVRTTATPRRVALIAVTSYTPGGTWSPVPMTRPEAVMALVAHSLTIRSRPDVTIAALKNMTADAVCLQGSRGDAMETASLIVDLLAR